MEDVTHLWMLFCWTGVASCPKSVMTGRDHFYAGSEFHLRKDLNFSLEPNCLCAQKMSQTESRNAGGEEIKLSHPPSKLRFPGPGPPAGSKMLETAKLLPGRLRAESLLEKFSPVILGVFEAFLQPFST